MPLYTARRDCNPGGVYYRQGQVVSFDAKPDPELFAPAGPGATAEKTAGPANPGGTPLSEETKGLIARENRPRKAVGSMASAAGK